jgi:hypothetical protein
MVVPGGQGAHWQVEGLKACPPEQRLVTHWPPQSVVPLGQPPPWHTPPTHSLPSRQRLKQLPQCRSFLCRFTHLSPQRACPVGQPQILPSPLGFLMQFLEQHWRSPVHLRP